MPRKRRGGMKYTYIAGHQYGEISPVLPQSRPPPFDSSHANAARKIQFGGARKQRPAGRTAGHASNKQFDGLQSHMITPSYEPIFLHSTRPLVSSVRPLNSVKTELSPNDEPPPKRSNNGQENAVEFRGQSHAATPLKLAMIKSESLTTVQQVQKNADVRVIKQHTCKLCQTKLKHRSGVRTHLVKVHKVAGERWSEFYQETLVVVESSEDDATNSDMKNCSQCEILRTENNQLKAMLEKYKNMYKLFNDSFKDL